jgi:hypothetical protein
MFLALEIWEYDEIDPTTSFAAYYKGVMLLAA